MSFTSQYASMLASRLLSLRKKTAAGGTPSPSALLFSAEQSPTGDDCDGGVAAPATSSSSILIHPEDVPRSDEDFTLVPHHVPDYTKYDYTPISKSVINRQKRKQQLMQQKEGGDIKRRKKEIVTTNNTSLFPGVYIVRPKAGVK